MMMIFPSTHRVTQLCSYPPVKTIVSPASGIPHAPSPLCANSKLPPPVKMCRRSKTLPFSNFDTWHSLCSVLCCRGPAAKQDNRVGKRRRSPGRVIISLHTVIVFLKMSVRHDWEKQIAVLYFSVIWFEKCDDRHRHQNINKGRCQKKNGIMWEKFPSGGPPPPPLPVWETPVIKKKSWVFFLHFWTPGTFLVFTKKSPFWVID